jgi:hypothetical protein
MRSPWSAQERGGGVVDDHGVARIHHHALTAVQTVHDGTLRLPLLDIAADIHPGIEGRTLGGELVTGTAVAVGASHQPRIFNRVNVAGLVVFGGRRGGHRHGECSDN